MATTQISDLGFEPVPFSKFILLNVLAKNSFINSGLARVSEELTQMANMGGRILTIPFWNSITLSEPNYGTDTATDVTPAKTSGDSQLAVRHVMNEHWSSMDLTAAIGGNTSGDPLAIIGSQVVDYWDNAINKRIAASLHGLILDNIATDASDMTYVVAEEVSGSVTAASKFSAINAINALATMGDNINQLGAMIVHSVVYATMQELNLIDTIPDSEGKTNIPTYQGKIVFVDDDTTSRAGTTSGMVYYTYFVGMGAISIGQGTPKTPTALYRNELTGNGEGEETLASRQQMIIHPNGFDWDQANTVAPSLATLALAASWTRKVPRKQVKIACLVSN